MEKISIKNTDLIKNPFSESELCNCVQSIMQQRKHLEFLAFLQPEIKKQDLCACCDPIDFPMCDKCLGI